MLNNVEYLLSCLSEECAETSQMVSKSLRFGLYGDYEGNRNIERVSAEINDIFAIVELLIEAGVDINIDKRLIEMKREKVKKYMELSKECGTLTQ